jgi:hypothetical protein
LKEGVMADLTLVNKTNQVLSLAVAVPWERGDKQHKSLPPKGKIVINEGHMTAEIQALVATGRIKVLSGAQ